MRSNMAFDFKKEFCVQIMHIGLYDDELATVAIMNDTLIPFL